MYLQYGKDLSPYSKKSILGIIPFLASQVLGNNLMWGNIALNGKKYVKYFEIAFKINIIYY